MLIHEIDRRGNVKFVGGIIQEVSRDALAGPG